MIQRMKDATLPNYRYRALRVPSSLRLLRLLPSSQANDDIDCHLLEVENLYTTHPDDIEGYEALSWCWGRGEKDQIIRIHEKQQIYQFSVTHPLKAALKALRLAHEVRILWVDAVCINQEDVEEKSSQVARMDEIYHRASNVRVWLGEADEDSKIAMDFLNTDLLSLWKFDKLYDDPRLDRNWSALVALMQRPWFTRRWVIQEIGLAVTATLQCGSDTVAWRDFADAVSLLMEKDVQKIPGATLRNRMFTISEGTRSFSALGGAVLVNVTNILFSREKGGKIEPLIGLEQLVSSLSIFEASEPRDTIYALLSLARDATRTAYDRDSSLASSSSKLIMEWANQHITRQQYRVDYTRPFHVICKEFIQFCVRTSDPSRALDIICRPWAPGTSSKRRRDHIHMQRPEQIQVDGSTPGLIQCLKSLAVSEMDSLRPSWIPALDDAAFEMYNHPVTGPRIARKNADPLVGLPMQATNYNAAGGRGLATNMFKFEKSRNYHSMFVKGFVLDSVSHVAEASRLGNVPAEWLEMAGWVNPRTDPPEDFWRTLVADQGLNGGRTPTIYARACKDCFEWVLEKGIPGGTFDTSRIIYGGSSSIVSDFLTKVQITIWNRRMFLSSSGRLGLSHENATKDDLVCILYGCSVPVILRKVIKTEKQVQEEVEMARSMLWGPGKEEATLKIQRYWRSKQQKKKRGKEPEERWTPFVWKQFQGRSKRPASPQHPSWERFKRFSDLDNLSNENPWQILKYIIFAIVLFEFLFWRPKFLITAFLLGEPSFWLVLLYKAILLLSLVLMVDDNIIVTSFELMMAKLKARVRRRLRRAPTIQDEGPEISDHYYQLIGACYLHGMMTGDAIRLQNEQNIKSERFEIR